MLKISVNQEPKLYGSKPFSHEVTSVLRVTEAIIAPTKYEISFFLALSDGKQRLILDLFQVTIKKSDNDFEFSFKEM